MKHVKSIILYFCFTYANNTLAKSVSKSNEIKRMRQSPDIVI